MSAPRCWCRCHNVPAGALLADALEAAVACSDCKNAHVVALSDEAIRNADYGPPRQWTPDADEGAE